MNIDNELFHNAQIGNAAEAKLMIEQGAYVNAIYKIGEVEVTPLYIAAQNGHTKVVELLLDNGAKVDTPLNTDGATALYIASLNGHAAVVECLLQAGARTDVEVNGHTALYAGVHNNHLVVVEILLKYNAIVQSGTPFNSLDIATMTHNKEAFTLLMKYYWESLEKSLTEPHIIEQNKEIFEVVVARYNEDLYWIPKEFPYSKVTVYNKGNDDLELPSNCNIVKLPDVGLDAHTHLFHIINNYHSLANRTLFIQGNPYDHTVFLPLIEYSKNDIQSGCKNIIAKCGSETLNSMSHGLNKLNWTEAYPKGATLKEHNLIEFTHTFVGDYPTDQVIHVNYGTIFSVDANKIQLREIEYYKKILNVLEETFTIYPHYVERLTDLIFQSALDTDISTLFIHEIGALNEQLCFAAEAGDIKKVEELLQQGANINFVHKIGSTPLYIAAQNGHSEVVELLLKKGADPEFIYSNGMTALCVAAYNGHVKAVKYLLDYGANIEASVGNTTVIHLAAQNGQKAVVRLLLEEGASLEPSAIVATKEQNILEILLQQGDHRIKPIGCYDGLSKEIFAQEGIDYDTENQSLMEDSNYRLHHIKEYTQDIPKIPLITHHIYFTSQTKPKEIDDLSLNKTIVSIQRLNQVDSNWKHYIWTNKADIIPDSLKILANVKVYLIDELVDYSIYSKLLEMLNQADIDGAMYSRASDLVRSMVLEKLGGVYYDLDYEIYKPEKLIEIMKAFDFIGGKEIPTQFAAIGSAFIAAKSAHVIIQNAINFLERNLNQNNTLPEYITYPCTKWHKTWYETNPIATTMAVYKSSNNATADLILPSNVLYNVDYARFNAPGSRCHNPNKPVYELDKETIGADMFCGSWSANENFLNFFYYPKNNNAYLFEAASFGYTRIVEYLFAEKKANINSINKEIGATPLHIAVQNGHISTVKYLLENGAEIEIKASNDLTPFCIAVQNKQLDIAKLLLEKGADIEAVFPSGVTSLYIAGYLKNEEMVQLLLDNRANKNIVIEMAMKNNHSDIVNIFSQLNFINDQLFTASQIGELKLAQDLIAKGANVNAIHKIGAAPLYIAAQGGHSSLVKLLIDNNAKLDATIADSRTALFIAAFNGHQEVVEALIKFGANIEYAIDGHTPLYAAIYNGHKDTVEFLLKAGASIEDNDHRFTPMFIAASKGLNKKATQTDKDIYNLVLEYYWKDVEKINNDNVNIQNDNSFEVVIARYNEPIDWIAKEFPNDKVTIYNKGDEITNPLPNWNIIKIPNIGLEPFSYFTHIATNYSNLADRVLFLQGIPYDHPVMLPLALYKRDIALECSNIIAKCENTSVQSEWNAANHTITTNGWETYDSGKYANVVVRNTFLEFMNQYVCPYPLETEFHINWGAEFAVDKQVIMKHPVEYYQAFLSTLDIQFPAEVHWLERLWDLVFQECPYHNLEI